MTLALAFALCSDPAADSERAIERLAVTRTQLFDHLAVPAPGPGPWRLVVHRDGADCESPMDSFGTRDGSGVELHLRARDLGERRSDPPPGARFRIVASTPDGILEREGFLLPAADAAATATGAGLRAIARLDAVSFRGPGFSLVFPGGSGFYADLLPDGASAPLVRAIRLRLETRLPAGLSLVRTEQDFRWQVIGLEVGDVVARRRSTASARALVRYTDPRPQEAFFSADLIEQEVEITLPASLLAVASRVTFQNGFEVRDDTRVLVPGEPSWIPVLNVRPGQPYDWLVIAAPAGGVLVHWLEPLGAASRLGFSLYAAAAAGSGAEIGYRSEDVTGAWQAASDDPAGSRGSRDAVALAQHVAVLGGPEVAARLLGDESLTRRLGDAMRAAPARWRAALEAIR